MSKLTLVIIALASTAGVAMAGMNAPSPGPLLGAIAGPWGLIASVAGYSAYRLYKAKR